MSDLQDTLDHVSSQRARIEARAMGADSEAERLRLWCAADALRDVEAHLRSEIARKAAERAAFRATWAEPEDSGNLVYMDSGDLVYIPARFGMQWSFDPNPEEPEAEGAGDGE